MQKIGRNERIRTSDFLLPKQMGCFKKWEKSGNSHFYTPKKMCTYVYFFLAKGG